MLRVDDVGDNGSLSLRILLEDCTRGLKGPRLLPIQFDELFRDIFDFEFE